MGTSSVQCAAPRPVRAAARGGYSTTRASGQSIEARPRALAGGEFTFDIGPDGGTAYDPISKASVSVPAGALTEATEITCKGFLGYSDFSAAFASTAEFVAGIRLEPDGLELAEPVTLYLPINADLSEMYKDAVLLFVWDEKSESWVWAADGVVDEAREFIVADISHFCTYAALEYPDGYSVQSVFDAYFGSSPAGDTAGELTATWWRNASNIVGRNHTVGGECYVAVGDFADLQWAIDREEDGEWVHYEGQHVSLRCSSTSTADSTQQSAFGVSGSINASTGVLYCAGSGVTATGTIGSSGGSGTWTSTATDDEGNVYTFSGTWTSS